MPSYEQDVCRTQILLRRKTACQLATSHFGEDWRPDEEVAQSTGLVARGGGVGMAQRPSWVAITRWWISWVPSTIAK
jgi:hypothetical protein